MSTSTNSFPDRWDLTTWYPELGGPEFKKHIEQIKQETAALAAKLEALPTATEAAELIPIVLELEALGAEFGHLSAYLGCLSAADAHDEQVKAEEAAAELLGAEVGKLSTALRARLAALEDAAFTALLQDPRLAGSEFTLRETRLLGTRQMESQQEALAADLNVDGMQAWGRLYETLTGKLNFTMVWPASTGKQPETLPMARRRALMADANRDFRLAAFAGGQIPWVEHETTFAAALNAIGGTRHTLYRRRGIEHFLNTPLQDAALSAASLEAMMAAIDANIEIPRRAVRAAAKLQGTSALHFCDLEAPQVLLADEKPILWDEACHIVDQAFSEAYPALGAYFREMLANSWIEAESRSGKRPGAFATGSLTRHEERVYMNWNGTMNDLVTLAHEVGHAWHSRVLREARPMAAGYPMTLAETASNFGEMILLGNLLAQPGLSEERRAWLADQEMLRASGYLLNIPMRFHFEKAFYEARADGEVPASRLGQLMRQVQARQYGDTLTADGADPLFWASKMHFFITGVSFYNFPYTVGYLLSQALYKRFRDEGASFLPQYESFLRATGQGSCETVALESLGADLTKPDFWAEGILGLVPTLEIYEAVAATRSKV